MKNPFRRERRPIPVQLSPLVVTHTVKHEYAVRPRPISAHLMITNEKGERWMAPAFSIYPGMADVAIQPFPLVFLTGRAEDAAKLNVDVRLHIDFEK